jgi:hypothetical protein
MNNWNVEGVADLNTITTREEGDNDYDNWRLNAYDAIASNGDAEVKRMMGTLYFDGASSVPGMRFGLEVNINKGLQLSKEAAEKDEEPVIARGGAVKRGSRGKPERKPSGGGAGGKNRKSTRF